MRNILLFLISCLVPLCGQQYTNSLTITPSPTLSATGVLYFEDSSGSNHTLGFKAPATATTTVWTLPSSDSMGCLSSNGAGVLSWGGCSGGITLPYVGTDATNSAIAFKITETGTSSSAMELINSTAATPTLSLVNNGSSGTALSVTGSILAAGATSGNIGSLTQEFSTIYAATFSGQILHAYYTYSTSPMLGSAFNVGVDQTSGQNAPVGSPAGDYALAITNQNAGGTGGGTRIIEFGGLSSDNTTIYGNFYPNATDTYSIGKTGYEFLNGYFQNVIVSGTCTGCGTFSLDRPTDPSVEELKWTVAGSSSVSGYWALGTIQNPVTTSQSLFTLNVGPSSSPKQAWYADETGEVYFPQGASFTGNILAAGVTSPNIGSTTQAFAATYSALFSGQTYNILYQTPLGPGIGGSTFNIGPDGSNAGGTNNPAGFTSGNTNYNNSLAITNVGANRLMEFAAGPSINEVTLYVSMYPNVTDTTSLGDSTYEWLGIQTHNLTASGGLTLSYISTAGCLAVSNTGVVTETACGGSGTYMLLAGGQTVTGTDTWQLKQTFMDASGATGGLNIDPVLQELQPSVSSTWVIGDAAHYFGGVYTSSVDVYGGGISFGPSQVANLNSAGGAYFTSALNIGSTSTSNTFLDSSGNGYFNTLYVGGGATGGFISGKQVIDSSQNGYFASVSASGGATNISPSAGGTVIGGASGYPFTEYYYASGGTNAKRWLNVAFGNVLQFYTADDADMVPSNWLLVTRSANTISQVAWPIVPAYSTGVAAAHFLIGSTSDDGSGMELQVTGTPFTSASGGISINTLFGTPGSNIYYNTYLTASEYRPYDGVTSLGDSTHRFYGLYATSGVFLGTTGIVTWGPSGGANLNSGGGATFQNTVNLAAGSFQIGGTTVLDASRNLTVASCTGCGSTSGANVNLSNLSSVAVNTDLLPGGTSGTLNLGNSSHYWGSAYVLDSILMGAAGQISIGSSVEVGYSFSSLISLGVSSGLTVTGGATVSGYTTLSNGLSVSSGESLTGGLSADTITSTTGATIAVGSGSITVGSGNFYLRDISGAPSCSGVANGWIGYDTSGDHLWVCNGGVAKQH
jgi:hypothetical protein